MGKSKVDKVNLDFNKISIDSFFSFESESISIAHSQVKPIHNSGNISASGGHFEVAVRNFFRKKLPDKFYISNGHIIDSSLKASPQIDLIIADSFKTPILYKTFDETEYLTYESIYSYAEIKSSWTEKHLVDFIISSKRINKFLNRTNISPNYIFSEGREIKLDVPTTNNPFQNPLFKFMFIANSETFSYEHIKRLYNDNDWRYLPNVLCLFDKGGLYPNKLTII